MSDPNAPEDPTNPAVSPHEAAAHAETAIKPGEPSPLKAADNAFVAAIEPEPAPAPEKIAAPPPVPQAASPARPSRWPMLAGLVGGAVLAVLGAIFLHMNDDASTALATLRHDVEVAGGQAKAVEAKLQAGLDTQEKFNETQGKAVAALEKRLIEAEARLVSPPPVAAGDAAAPPVTPLSGTGAVVGQPSTADVAAAVALLQAPDLSGIKAKIADTEAGTARQAAALETKIGALDGRLAQVETTLAAPKVVNQVVEAKIDPPKAPADLAAQLVIARSVLDALGTGAPFPAEMAALANLGVDEGKLAPLKAMAATGAPQPAALSASLQKLRAGLAAADAPPPPANPGWLDRISASAARLVKVRRAGDPAGDEIDAIVARMEAALAKNDLEGAAAEWAKLPASAQALSGDWIAGLKLRLAGTIAAHDLVADAIAGLGGRK